MRVPLATSGDQQGALGQKIQGFERRFGLVYFMNQTQD